MSGRIVVNLRDLLSAGKLMGTAQGEFQLLARKIASDPMPGMPPAIAAQVRSGVGRTSAALFRHASELDEVVSEFHRRAKWAELANACTEPVTLTTLRRLRDATDKVAPKRGPKKRRKPPQIRGR